MIIHHSKCIQTKNLGELICCQTVSCSFKHSNAIGRVTYVSINKPVIDGYTIFNAEILSSSYGSTTMYTIAHNFTLLQGIANNADLSDTVKVRFWFVKNSVISTS